jgi:hypothetical protein
VGVYLAGRYFHGDLDLTILALADLPSMAIGAYLQGALFGVSASRMMQSYVDAVVWLSFGTVQWWGIGVVIGARRSNRAAYNLPLRPTSGAQARRAESR